MGINEKSAEDREYVAIFRTQDRSAITMQCADVRTREGWIKFEDAHGNCLMTAPADMILMVIEGKRYAAMAEQARAAQEEQEARQRIMKDVDPSGILDPRAVVQP